MKTKQNNTRNRILFILALAGVLLLAACATPTETTIESAGGETAVIPATTPADTTSQPEVAAEAPVAEIEVVTETEIVVETAVDTPAVVATISATGELSDEEIADLLFMREEEKLARDVYLALYDVWGMNLFTNIAASEQTHTDAILNLINSYGLTDPVGSNVAGVFENADLQALYDQLVATGSQSLADALNVGAAIEEIDIIDLDEAIARTGAADIVQVYQSLRAGSENHLRAFVNTLEQQTGTAYQPQYLTSELYAAIMSGSQGNGNAGSNGNGNGSNGNRGNGNGGNGRGNGRGSNS